MKKFITVLGFCALLILSGCTSAFSVLADARPAIAPTDLSKQLSARYSQLGYAADTLPERSNDEFKLGRWYSEDRGFIGHAESDGVLRIWIAPRAQQDDAKTVVEDLKKILAEIAPSAVVTIREARSLDTR